MAEKRKHPFALWLSGLPIFAESRGLWERNRRDINLPLSKLQKLLVGTYLILSDYSEGKFPPHFPDRQKAYDAEIDSGYSRPGMEADEITDYLLRKPFYFDPSGKQYLSDYVQLVEFFRKLKIAPPRKILELGCGTGWMAEFLAIMKFSVLGTSISPSDIQSAKLRIRSLKIKQLSHHLEFQAIPMESVDRVVPKHGLFDCLYVYEALHHAYDWREAIRAGYNCLKPGGWFIIANEPNVLHTFISYRISKLIHTHEIGFSYEELKYQLGKAGFRKIKRLKNRMGLFFWPHWIAAQK